MAAPQGLLNLNAILQLIVADAKSRMEKKMYKFHHLMYKILHHVTETKERQ